MGVLNTSEPVQMRIMMLNPKQEPTASLLATNWGLKDMHVLKNQDRDTKFEKWVYQRLLTIYKSRSSRKPLVENLQHP